MTDSDSEGIIKQISRKLAGTLGFVLCAVGILGFLVAGFAIDYIDGELEKECEGAKGSIVQGVGLDEGQCDEGSTIRDLLVLIRYPLLLAGVVVCLIAANVF